MSRSRGTKNGQHHVNGLWNYNYINNSSNSKSTWVISLSRYWYQIKKIHIHWDIWKKQKKKQDNSIIFSLNSFVLVVPTWPLRPNKFTRSTSLTFTHSIRPESSKTHFLRNGKVTQKDLQLWGWELHLWRFLSPFPFASLSLEMRIVWSGVHYLSALCNSLLFLFHSY